MRKPNRGGEKAATKEICLGDTQRTRGVHEETMTVVKVRGAEGEHILA